MFRFLLVWLILVWSGSSWSNQLVLAEKGQYPLSSHLSYYIDETGSLSFEDILLSEDTINWIQAGDDVPNFGFLPYPVWTKVELLNQNANVHDWALEIAYPQLDSVEVYFVNDKKQLTDFFVGGDQHPIEGQIFTHPHLVFPAQLFPYEPATLYFKIQTEGSNQIPASIWQWDAFNFHSLTHFLIQGLFYGMVLVMALYNLVVWLTEKQGIYLNYVAYILSFTIFQSSLSGIGSQYIWPNQTWVNELVTPISLSVLIASLNLFIRDFFETKDKYLKIDFTLISGFWLCSVIAAASPFISYHYAILISSTVTSIFLIYAVFIAAYMLKTGHPSSRYFALAWSLFISGALLLAANKFGIIPVTTASEYGLQFGAGMEIMFLSLALADRMARTQNEKILAQEESLKLAHQITEEQERTFNVELENLRLEKQAHEKLERQVEERTIELKSALEKLSIAHDKLQTISVTDALTELHNRYYFNEHWKIEFKRAYRDGSEIAIIMMDIDHFKTVNDKYGHPAGDACLKAIAHCIQKHAARESDICCRYGGEEFAIILPATPVLGALEVAENIREEIENTTIQWEKLELNVTASFGISGGKPKTTRENSRQFFINQADQALYQAKHQGRNKVVIFTQDVL